MERGRGGEELSGGILAEFQQTCECFSVPLSKKDTAVEALPEMKCEKMEAAQVFQSYQQNKRAENNEAKRQRGSFQG